MYFIAGGVIPSPKGDFGIIDPLYTCNITSSISSLEVMFICRMLNDVGTYHGVCSDGAISQGKASGAHHCSII
jgi:hypothetical protein